MVGLANGGKTTLVNCLKPTQDKDHEVVPTVGFSVERFTLHKCKLTVIDMSGQAKYMDLWECYYKDCQAVVFVIDAAAGEEVVQESKEMLHVMMAHKELKGRPLLVFANKSDLPAAQGATQLAQDIGLTSEVFAKRAWHIGACSALKGTGIDEGIKWLVGRL